MSVAGTVAVAAMAVDTAYCGYMDSCVCGWGWGFWLYGGRHRWFYCGYMAYRTFALARGLASGSSNSLCIPVCGGTSHNRSEPA